MEAFEQAWANPAVPSFGGMEKGHLDQFSTQLVSNADFQKERSEGLRELYRSKGDQVDQTGILRGEQGLAFIDEAFAAITG